MEPDSGHSHDPYTEASVYPESCVSACNTAHYDRYCCADSDSVYCFGNRTWSCSFTCILLCISDPLYPAVHDAGNKSEKSICTPLRRTALGGEKNELENTLDEAFWNM